MRLRWSKSAVDDLTHICDYTEDRFGQVQAHRAAVGVYEAAGSLTDMPQRGRKGRKPGTRELAVPNFPFIVVYRAEEETAEIIRVLHSAQQWP